MILFLLLLWYRYHLILVYKKIYNVMVMIVAQKGLTPLKVLIRV